MRQKPAHTTTAGSRYLELQRYARTEGRATSELLQLYVLEGFLRRLVRSSHRERLVLKGGMLLAAFDLRRTTRDVDLLALGVDNDPAVVERMVVEVSSIAEPCFRAPVRTAGDARLVVVEAGPSRQRAGGLWSDLRPTVCPSRPLRVRSATSAGASPRSPRAARVRTTCMTAVRARHSCLATAKASNA